MRRHVEFRYGYILTPPTPPQDVLSQKQVTKIYLFITFPHVNMILGIKLPRKWSPSRPSITLGLYSTSYLSSYSGVCNIYIKSDQRDGYREPPLK